jgi:putative acetyltransferase
VGEVGGVGSLGGGYDGAMSVTIRNATPEDCEGILAVHVASIRTLCASDYTPEQIEAWAGPKRAEGYLGPIRDNYFVVAVEEGRMVGFGELVTNAAGGECAAELRGLYIHPKHARKGVGAAIVAALRAEAVARGARRWVLRATITAEAFYRRMGFVPRSRGTHAVAGGVEVECVEMDAELREADPA